MRENWIDAWKGWLILSVVVGHVVGGGSHFSADAACAVLRGIYFWIYSFHMPAFFFIAGWLWHRKTFGVFVCGRFKRLVVPYLVVGVISIGVYFAMYGGRVSGAADSYYVESAGDAGGLFKSFVALVHAGGWPNGNGFRFNSVLWFLPCMFSAELIYWAIDTLIPSRKFQLAFAILLFIACFWSRYMHVPILPWGLDKMPRFLPWLMFGRWAHPLLANKRDWKTWELFVLAAIHIGLVWLCWNVFAGTSKYWFGALSIAAGIMLSFEVSHLTVRNAVLAKGVAVLGMSSMSIMLWHKFFVVGAQMKLSVIKILYGSGVFGAIIASTVITVGSIIVVLMGNRVYDKFANRIRGWL